MQTASFSRVDLRCPLFIPGNRSDMLGKAGRYSASAYIPDLEDSVPVGNKEEAREVTGDALPSLAEVGRPVVPRVNSLSTGLTEDDLKAMVGPYIVGISIGKVKIGRGCARGGCDVVGLGTGRGYRTWEYRDFALVGDGECDCECVWNLLCVGAC